MIYNNNDRWQVFQTENHHALNVIDFFELHYKDEPEQAKQALETFPDLKFTLSIDMAVDRFYCGNNDYSQWMLRNEIKDIFGIGREGFVSHQDYHNDGGSRFFWFNEKLATQFIEDIVNERKLREPKEFCPIDQQIRVLIVDDLESDYEECLSKLKFECAHLISEIDYIKSYEEAKKLAETKLDYDLVISDTQIGFNFSNKGEEYLGYNLLPYFMDQGIYGILMSSVDYSEEAKKINAPFFLKSSEPQELGKIVNDIHKRRMIK